MASRAPRTAGGHESPLGQVLHDHLLCPMATWTHPSTPAGSLRVSILRRRQSPTHANPTMTALSLSANACVELPRTSLSMRRQPISSTHDAASVGSVSVGCREILQTSPEPSVVSRARGCRLSQWDQGAQEVWCGGKGGYAALR